MKVKVITFFATFSSSGISPFLFPSSISRTMASFLFKSAGVALGATYVEKLYGPKDPENLFGATTVLLIGTGLWSVLHGMKVGKARSKYMELATKDGEEDVEHRYALPNLYVQGISKHARAFNAIQRSHQHIFETFPQLALSAMVGALNFPITAALSTLVYVAGRVAFSNGYANSEGDVSKRYSSKLAPYMWYGLLVNFAVGIVSSIKIIASKKIS